MRPTATEISAVNASQLDNNLYLSIINISSEKLLDKLNTFNVNKGPGPDEIPAFILKLFSQLLVTPLHYLFNLSLSSGIYPDCFKHSHIVPIYESGDKSSISNYKPISIQCTKAKLFESLVLHEISPLISPYFSVHQHGFMKKRSTLTNLMTFQQYVMDAFDSKAEESGIDEGLSLSSMEMGLRKQTVLWKDEPCSQTLGLGISSRPRRDTRTHWRR
ncbi:hypothetical protein O3M35_010230 [Rhynocoris fuscipes]|uniref:Reverse transcriptase domain-containing protein n=1 Tax=Rhynocoris fuscipes TaxID=488301 RepID=A0AAW1D1B1_9HEMI